MQECDTQDFVRVDTRSIRTKDGVKQFWWLVLGNPCLERGLIPYQAPQVTCDGDRLEQSILSDHGHVILGLFLDSTVGEAAGGAALSAKNEATYADQCIDRAAQGYRSGMTDIFRKVAAITPLVTRTAAGEVCSARALTPDELTKKRHQLLTGDVSPEALAAVKERQAQEQQSVRLHQLRMQQLSGESQCGTENGVCRCTGQVRFGFADQWSEYTHVDGDISCSNHEFGDPAPGQGKICMCKAGPSVCYKSLSKVDMKLVAEDEGPAVGGSEGDDVTLDSCKIACSGDNNCKSFAWCPSDNHGCFLKNRALNGTEATKRTGRVYDCETFYEVPCGKGQQVKREQQKREQREQQEQQEQEQQQQGPSGPCDDELDQKFGLGYCDERKKLCASDAKFQKVCRKTCGVCDKIPSGRAAQTQEDTPVEPVEPLIKGSTEVAVPRGGTAEARLHSAVTLTAGAGLDGDWSGVRRQLLMACGLRDLADHSRVGQGFTGASTSHPSVRSCFLRCSPRGHIV